MKTEGTMDLRFVIGIAFGPGSVRTVIVSAESAKESPVAFVAYPQRIMSDKCDPTLARHYPSDYLSTRVDAVRQATEVASARNDFAGDQFIAIGLDATGSTPLVPVSGKVCSVAFVKGFGTLIILPVLSENLAAPQEIIRGLFLILAVIFGNLEIREGSLSYA
jgi:hypothetical protein